VEAHEYVRGEGRKVSFRAPDHLVDKLRAEGSRVYSQRKIGKYLSKLVYNYVRVLELQSQQYMEGVDTSTDWVELLKENYDADLSPGELPDDLTIPATPKAAVPLGLVLLRSQSPDVYPTKLVDVIVENTLSNYTDVKTDRTLDSYADGMRDYLTQTVILYDGGLMGPDYSQEYAGYYDDSNEGALDKIESDVVEWARAWTEWQASDANDIDQLGVSEVNRLNQTVAAVREQYGEFEAVEELDELL
jgi:hypothetical protein